ncbi:hypothetical protein FGO68_gene6048 [Halteria grandinella]|uniref:Uncharacterized protein n=1 Tax=Halteria grandinella TaxID=5974 RepID=A0A8J8P3T3_HALGN|nr:hypothetical protein FGO68_gene6048 [Halteria grandinella]
MNQQSCQKALLKCSKINKRRHKDESKVKRLLSRLMKEMPAVAGSQLGRGSGGVHAHQGEAHVPQQKGSLYDRAIMPQDLKCDLSQRFSERLQPSDQRGPESPERQQSHKGMNGFGERETSRRWSRKDVDGLLQHIWRSHQNAVKMEKSVSRAIEVYKKTPAEESPCHTIISQSELARYRDSSVNNNMKGLPIDDSRLGSFLQWPHNKQATQEQQYDNLLEAANRLRYGQSQIQMSAQDSQVLELERISNTAAADLSRMLPSTGVKSLDKLRPPPTNVLPRNIQQASVLDKTAGAGEPPIRSHNGQQLQHIQMIDAANTMQHQQQQPLITTFRLPPRPNNQNTIMANETGYINNQLLQSSQDQLSPPSQQPFLEGDFGATLNQPPQNSTKKPQLALASAKRFEHDAHGRG